MGHGLRPNKGRDVRGRRGGKPQCCDLVHNPIPDHHAGVALYPGAGEPPTIEGKGRLEKQFDDFF